MDTHIIHFSCKSKRAAWVSAVSTPVLCLDSVPLTASQLPQHSSIRSEAPPYLIPFPTLFLVATKGRCFHIPFPKNASGAFLVCWKCPQPWTLSKTGPPSSVLQGRGKQMAERSNRDGFSPTPHSHDHQIFKISEKPMLHLEVPFNPPQPKGNL